MAIKEIIAKRGIKLLRQTNASICEGARPAAAA